MSTNKWHTGICDGCCGDKICCLAFCFPCAILGYNVHLMQTALPDNKLVNECPQFPLLIPTCACFLYSAGLFTSGTTSGLTAGDVVGDQVSAANTVSCLSVALHALVRHTIRQHNPAESKSPGNACDTQCACCGEWWQDICCALWCHSCAMAQENRLLKHLRDEENKKKEASNKDKSNNSMHFPLIDPKDHEP